MTSDTVNLGLLLDVDGPIASPITRTIAIPSIASDLVELADAGVPVVFNTGRSDEFLRGEVVGPLIAGGLGPDARVYGVCEKGAVWFRITPDGVGELTVDDTLVLPPALREGVERLIDERFADSMFFDHTKRTMISVEQRTEVDSDHYLAVQPELDRAVQDLCRTLGLGTLWRTEAVPNDSGAIEVRIDPTIISTDIESVRVGKDLGAERALELVAAAGPLPTRWRTVGDSRSDYAMADWLHRAGYDVAHVDVRPADGVPETPYDVLTAPAEATNDTAGAAFLTRWTDSLATGALTGRGIIEHRAGRA